jgi:hypothetical protein
VKDETKRGLREAAGAIAAAVGAGLLIAAVAALLTGCAGGEAFAKYSHRSSIPDYRDLNTSDTVAGCVRVNLCATCGDYAPRMVGCVHWETTGKPVYGRDPIGELQIEQPVWGWK